MDLILQGSGKVNRQYKVMSIQDLLHIEHLAGSLSIGIIFITTKPNYYNFSCTPFYIFNTADTDTPIFSKNKVSLFNKFLEVYRNIETWYICCDAGLSRSPAVAAYVAEYYNDFITAAEITLNHRFINIAIYNKLKENK